MEDLSQKLRELLNDPSAMEQIKGLTGLLGAKTEEETPAQPTPQPPAAAMPDPKMLGSVMKLMPLLGSVNREDDSTRLLRALKPFLHSDRARRVDSASRLLGIMKLLPLLRGTGLELFG